jgi:hypothetical protein
MHLLIVDDDAGIRRAPGTAPPPSSVEAQVACTA